MAEKRHTTRRGLERLLPESAFWRLALATAVLAVFTAVGAMLVSKYIGRKLVYSISEESAYTVLRSAVDLIGRTSIQIDEARSRALEARKQTLLDSLSFIEGYIQTHAASAGMNPGECETCFEQLDTLAKGVRPFYGVLDAAGQLRVLDEAGFAAVADPAVFVDLFDAAGTAPGKDVFELSFPENGGNAVLLAARLLPQWGVTLFSATPLLEDDPVLQEKSRLTRNEMRARLNEIVVAESGYVYVFDRNCDMIMHPTLIGENFSAILLPGDSRSMCEALRETAEKPWGQNKIIYNWDRPENQGEYVHKKISWCTVEPTTGWIVGASVYMSDLDAPLATFVTSIFLPALGSILLLGLALALILRSLLKPVNVLSKVCQKVSHGDLNVAAPEGGSGEIGKLCWHFNTMIKRIRGLRQRDERRRGELEDLNQNLERKVQLRTRALERKAHKLEEANIRLKELDALKTNFVSSVSHELRTPLTSILGFTKMIRRDFKMIGSKCDLAPAGKKPVQRVQGNLEIIIQEGERLSRLINDLLDLARIEAGRLEWHDSLLNFQEMAMDCLDAMYAQFQAKPDVSVRHDIEPGLPALYADRDRLTQVLINLLQNALKFTQQGEILLQACQYEGVLQCRVCDSGSGIQRGELIKVFDKFHQAAHDTCTATGGHRPGGTGLGLAICHNILEHYDGLIWAESTQGQGTEFIFEMPMRADQEQRSSHSGHMEAPVARAEDQGATPLVLVVDDDRNMQSLLLHIFEDAGYRVTTASDGATALKRIKATPPDLITMDLLMPGMPGSEIIALLRSQPEYTAIPVILVSALADMGADNYTLSDAVLTKPIDEELLLATTQALLLQDPLPNELREFARQGQAPAGQAMVCDTEGNCSFCNLQQVLEQVAAGFTGQVFVSRGQEEAPELAKIVGRAGVQVVMF